MRTTFTLYPDKGADIEIYADSVKKLIRIDGFQVELNEEEAAVFAHQFGLAQDLIDMDGEPEEVEVAEPSHPQDFLGPFMHSDRDELPEF